MLVDPDGCPSPSDLEADQLRAEGLLFELAKDLRHVPLEERTRALHLRALALKQAVARWPQSAPDPASRQALCEEVLAMQRETRDWRRSLRSGWQLVHAARSTDPQHR
jgi:hypothetical protein